MFIVVMMAAALAVGYAVTVVISLAFTFAVAATAPGFVETDHLIRTRYKLVHETLWLLSALGGGFAAGVVGRGIHPVLTEFLLVAALVWILWDNSWEARQRGLLHQLLLTISTLLGVAAGYFLEARIA